MYCPGSGTFSPRGEINNIFPAAQGSAFSHLFKYKGQMQPVAQVIGDVDVPFGAGVLEDYFPGFFVI